MPQLARKYEQWGEPASSQDTQPQRLRLGLARVGPDLPMPEPFPRSGGLRTLFEPIGRPRSEPHRASYLVRRTVQLANGRFEVQVDCLVTQFDANGNVAGALPRTCESYVVLGR